MTITAAATGPQGYASRYPSRPESVRRVRKDVAMFLATWHLEHISESAELIVTELFTNAIVHGSGCPRVDVQRKADGVEIAVSDRSRTRPCPQPADEDAERGRGLLIVKALSRSWGMSSAPGGKRVWAVVSS